MPVRSRIFFMPYFLAAQMPAAVSWPETARPDYFENLPPHFAISGMASCIIHALAGSAACKNLARLQLDVKVVLMNGSKNIGK